MDALRKRLDTRKSNQNFRSLSLETAAIDFSSNDYLGLARCKDLAAEVQREVEMQKSPGSGFGSTGSRLLTGNCKMAELIEEELATLHGCESAHLFSCGYMANVGLLSSIAQEGDVILYDSQIHASMRDGIRLSRASGLAFRHHCLEHLNWRLAHHRRSGNCFLCIESIDSVDGKIAPLEEIFALADQYDAWVILDEAHSFGVTGEDGRGVIAPNKRHKRLFAQVVTFGKALGSFGAAILGNHLLKETLLNFATSAIYTTALPLVSLASIRCSLRRLPYLESERSNIKDLIKYSRSLFPTPSFSHIQPIPMQDNQQARKTSKELFEKGFDLRPLLSPTVQRGKEILRLSLHSFNTKEEIHNLFSCIN